MTEAGDWTGSGLTESAACCSDDDCYTAEAGSLTNCKGRGLGPFGSLAWLRITGCWYVRWCLIFGRGRWWRVWGLCLVFGASL